MRELGPVPIAHCFFSLKYILHLNIEFGVPNYAVCTRIILQLTCVLPQELGNKSESQLWVCPRLVEQSAGVWTYPAVCQLIVQLNRKTERTERDVRHRQAHDENIGGRQRSSTSGHGVQCHRVASQSEHNNNNIDRNHCSLQHSDVTLACNVTQCLLVATIWQ